VGATYLTDFLGIEVYPAAWEETTADHMINKYRVMTVVSCIASDETCLSSSSDY